MERDELYRKEVWEGKLTSSYSKPVEYDQKLWLKQSVLLGLLLIFILLVLGKIQYRETESAIGHLVSRDSSIAVVTPKAAIIEEIFVAVGQAVMPGQRLAQLSSTIYDDKGLPRNELESRRLSVQRQFLLAQLNVMDELQAAEENSSAMTHDRLVARQDILDLDELIFRTQLLNSEGQLNSAELLLSQGALTKTQFDQYYNSHLQLRRQAQQLSIQRQDLEHSLAEGKAQQSRSRLNSQRERLQLRNHIAEIEFELDRVAQRDIVSLFSPTEGVVEAVRLQTGQFIASNQKLFEIGPLKSELHAIIFVPSRLRVKLFPGQEILLAYESYDYRHFGRYAAVIDSISSASLDPREQLLPLTEIREPVYRVSAALRPPPSDEPNPIDLQTGLVFQADFVTAEMSLLAVLFRPLLSMRGKLV